MLASVDYMSTILFCRFGTNTLVVPYQGSSQIVWKCPLKTSLQTDDQLSASELWRDFGVRKKLLNKWFKMTGRYGYYLNIFKLKSFSLRSELIKWMECHFGICQVEPSNLQKQTLNKTLEVTMPGYTETQVWSDQCRLPWLDKASKAEKSAVTRLKQGRLHSTSNRYAHQNMNESYWNQNHFLSKFLLASAGKANWTETNLVS